MVLLFNSCSSVDEAVSAPPEIAGATFVGDLQSDI
jgi:hypothetical protein